MKKNAALIDDVNFRDTLTVGHDCLNDFDLMVNLEQKRKLHSWTEDLIKMVALEGSSITLIGLFEIDASTGSVKAT